MKPVGLRTGIAVCSRCAGGLDERRLMPPEAGNYLCFLGEICENPDVLEGFVRENRLESLVVAACADPGHLASIRSACARTGISPLAIEYIPLKELYAASAGGPPTAELARLALAVNGARASKGHLVGWAVPRFPVATPLSRREFLLNLRGRPREPSEVPIYLKEVCSPYFKTCGYCVDACPSQAITKGVGGVAVDPWLCVECGACASACPVGALQLPTISDLQLAKVVEVAARMEAHLEKRVLLATCREGIALLGARAAEGGFSNPGFVTLRVPCIASLSWAHLLLLAAGGVSLVALCPNPSTCPKAPALSYTWRAFTLANELLRLMGIDDVLLENIAVGKPEELAQALGEAYRRAPRFTGRAMVASGEQRRPLLRSSLGILVALSDKPGEGRLVGEASQFYDILVEAGGCTLCGACAAVCPEGAIRLKDEGGLRNLAFNPSMCVGCYACVSACPEKVLTIEKAFQPKHIAERTWLVKARDELVWCRSCGLPVAAKRTVDRVARKLEAAGFEQALQWVTLCEGCKGRGWGSR